MRFCLLNTFFPPMHFGGDAIFTASLANLLARAGHEVEVVHCADSFHLLQGAVSPSSFPLHGPRLALRGRAGADIEPWLRRYPLAQRVPAWRPGGVSIGNGAAADDAA